MRYAKKLKDYNEGKTSSVAQGQATVENKVGRRDPSTQNATDQAQPSDSERRRQVYERNIREATEGGWLAAAQPIPFIQSIYPNAEPWLATYMGSLFDLGSKPISSLHNPSHSSDTVSTAGQAAELALAAGVIFESQPDQPFHFSPKAHEHACERLAKVMAPIFGEPIDVWCIVIIAKLQYLKTKNPLWPFMIVGLCIRAGIIPPPWIWRYFCDVASLVLQGASSFHLTLKSDRQRNDYLDERLVEKIGLKKVAGKRDNFTTFRQTLTDLRLAFKVRALLPSSTDKKTGISLTKACEKVANELRDQSKRATRREIAAENKLVWKAFHRWFKKDGSLLGQPRPR